MNDARRRIVAPLIIAVVASSSRVGWAQEAPDASASAMPPREGDAGAPNAPNAIDERRPESDASTQPIVEPTPDAGEASSLRSAGTTEPSPNPDEAPAEASGGGVSAASGSLRAAYWSSNRRLEDRHHFGTLALWMRVAPRITPNAAMVVEGWVRNDDVFRGERSDGLLREAYADLTAGPIDFRLGKQIVVWGRADAINPTDNISPRDFTLLVPGDDDQRSGAYALRARWFVSNISFSASWLPGFQAHVVPIPALPPPLVLRDASPRLAQTLAQAALKVEQTGEAIDWSLSYFDGFDRAPDLGVGNASATAVEVLLRHHRIRVAGADFAANAGRFGLRGETALTFTEDWERRDPETKKPFFFGVLGVDRTFGEYLNVNIQYLFRAVINFESPFAVVDPFARDLAIEQAVVSDQLDRIQQGATIRIADKWFNETLDTDLSGVVYAPRWNYAIRGRVTYAFSDRFKGVVGVDYFDGEDPSFFRTLHKNSTAFSEIRMNF